MKRLFVCLISLISLAYLLIAMGFRINLTDSIPVGLYRIIHEGELKNAYVIFCPDNRHAFRLGLDRGYLDWDLCESGAYTFFKAEVKRWTKSPLTPMACHKLSTRQRRADDHDQSKRMVF